MLNGRPMRGRGGNVSEIFVSFQGEGLHAGRRHLFVRLGGCPLRCRYCDTPESLVPVPECRILGPDGERRRANPFTPSALEAEVQALVAVAPPLAALAVTGGEPLAQTDFLAAWLGMRAGGLPVLLETAGILPARLARLLPEVAIVSLDLKCPSNTGERARWDEHAACLEAAVAAGRDVYVKMPVDEGTLAEEVEHGARLVAAVHPAVPLFLTPLTLPHGTDFTISAATLERLHAVASRRHPDVRVLPQLHKVLGIL
ncbi:MAG: 7-carboxy-7-deazaguanine synthase QueE [Deltaproteobacteria bacterium]|nr:MAG: 7-carboxy-7-deazaguanine synthase QueE [Deltaproteobacteria bacterium]TMA58309.1 MAG: 7-carboxy-7-deazaguanine synthase QueE [Deltaproteobacteria bacterium]